MKVWIVGVNDEDGESIEAIVSTKKKAKKAVMQISRYYDEEIFVMKWKINNKFASDYFTINNNK